MKQFTVEEIRAIREEYKVEQGDHRTAVNIIELAQRYGVSQITIRKIAKGHSYGWVK